MTSQVKRCTMHETGGVRAETSDRASSATAGRPDTPNVKIRVGTRWTELTDQQAVDLHECLGFVLTWNEGE
jgi:hypothetical protein